MMYNPSRTSPWPRELVSVFLLFEKILNSFDSFHFAFLGPLNHTASTDQGIIETISGTTLCVRQCMQMYASIYIVTKLSCLTEPLVLWSMSGTRVTRVWWRQWIVWQRIILYMYATTLLVQIGRYPLPVWKQDMVWKPRCHQTHVSNWRSRPV